MAIRRPRLLVSLLAVSGMAHAQAQPAPQTDAIPPPPPPPAQPVAQPAPPQAAPPLPRPEAAPPESSRAPREPVELHLLLGFGSAVCDNEKPDSDCPVDGGAAFALGGGWRFHDHWSVGLELAAWSFKVRDSWKGQLQDDATDVKFGSAYLAAFARWYWFDPGTVNPYLQAGLGFGTVTAEASNKSSTYTYSAPGIVYPLAIGAEFQVSKLFRIGPQFAAYLHVANKVCQDTGGNETCNSPGKNEDGEREGLALPWRFVAVGTFTFGS